MKIAVGCSLDCLFVAQAKQSRNPERRCVRQKLRFPAPALLHVFHFERKTILLIRMGGVDQYHARNLSRVGGGEEAHNKSTGRVSYKDIWPGNIGLFEQRVQFLGDRRAGTWSRAWIAVADSRAVVRADARESCDPQLHAAPREIRIAQTGLENDRWCALSGAVDMHEQRAFVRSYIHALPRHGIKPPVASFRDVFV